MTVDAQTKPEVRALLAEGAVKAAMEEKVLGDAYEIIKRYSQSNTARESALKALTPLWDFLMNASIAHGLKYEMEGPRKAIIGERS